MTETFKSDWEKLHEEGYSSFSGRDVWNAIFYHGLKYIPEGSKVLDIGCGSGDMFMNLENRIGQYNGIDISHNVCEKLIEKYKDNPKIGAIKTCAGNGHIPFSDNVFDVVVSCLVLQHIRVEFIEEYLKHSNRVLKDKGYLIFHTTTWNHIKDLKIEDHKDYVYGGMYSHTKEILSPILDSSNFDLIQSYALSEGMLKAQNAEWNLFICRKR